MVRRLIVALVALLIAAVGGVLTFLYASGADSRAMARMEPVQVLVVAEPIAQGTAADEIARSITVTEVPAAAVVPGGVTDLTEVSGLLTATDLQPGEQLLASRFIAPEAVVDEIEVPADLHQLSIQLETQRVIGGEIHPGDTVGVFVSADVQAQGGNQSLTSLILHKVLVVSVQGTASVTTDENGDQVEEEAQDSIVVTLALSAPDAELVVFGQEFGNVWLSLEGPEVPEDGTRVVDPGVVFQ